MEQLRKDGDNTNNNRKYNLPETMEDIADAADMTTQVTQNGFCLQE